MNRHVIILLLMMISTLLLMIFVPSCLVSNNTNEAGLRNGITSLPGGFGKGMQKSPIVYEDAVGSALAAEPISLAEMKQQLASAVSGSSSSLTTIAPLLQQSEKEPSSPFQASVSQKLMHLSQQLITTNTVSNHEPAAAISTETSSQADSEGARIIFRQ